MLFPRPSDKGAAVAYLIDGYNLLFAYLGAHPRRGLSKALERNRRRLLELLRKGHGSEATAVTVVFDAARAPADTPAEGEYHGIHVTFAIHDLRADDLIERLIRKAPAPRYLNVVTDDRHIQRAARRRHCTVLSCTDYLEWLEHHGKPMAEPRPVLTKPDKVSPEEIQRWLGEFSGMQNDPHMKKLADPFGPR
jgi:predicted RNA-binding protein with PIN domain